MLVAASACSQRTAPYRFRTPLVSAVRAAPLPERGAREVPAVKRPQAAAWLSPAAAEAGARASATTPAADSDDAQRQRRAQSADRSRSDEARVSNSLAQYLRAHAGSPVPGSAQSSASATSINFAFDVLATLGAVAVTPARQATSGDALLAVARTRDAVLPPARAQPLTGDLVLFSASAGGPLTVGVAIAPLAAAGGAGRHAGGVGAIEVLYAADGTAHVATISSSGRCRASDDAKRCIDRGRIEAFLRLDRLTR